LCGIVHRPFAKAMGRELGGFGTGREGQALR
jgi:hypothetical protein